MKRVFGSYYVGSNPRNAPTQNGDSGSEEDDEDRAFIPVAGGRKARIAAAKGHKAEHYRTLEEETAVLDRFTQELTEAAAAPESEDEEDEDGALAAFKRRMAAAAASAAHPAHERVVAAQNKQTPKEKAIAVAARKLRKAAAQHPIPWPYAGAGLNTAEIRGAQTKVAQMEAALGRPFPPQELVELVLWNAALRPPWPVLGGVWKGLKPVPLLVLIRRLEERFGVTCAGLMPLDVTQQRVALLAQWLMEGAPCGLAFVLSPVNETAQGLSRLPAAAAVEATVDSDAVHVLSLGNMTREARETSTWAYVGTVPVSASLIEAARPVALFS
jgi:hypothetical protein